ncbi:Ig-like domain-containing protein [Mycobacterium sp. SMC-4]|uniref:Ig-like domain-containing protein n=1 Tax=Mycobacterium sp. SMC-4 TaxID=2857059 RepID=UPI003CFD3CCD
MAQGRHVGRVGALAVALGIGTAVGLTPGVAAALPDDTASTRAGTDTDESSQRVRGEASERRSARAHTKTDAVSGDESDSANADVALPDVDEPASTPTRRTRSSSNTDTAQKADAVGASTARDRAKRIELDNAVAVEASEVPERKAPAPQDRPVATENPAVTVDVVVVPDGANTPAGPSAPDFVKAVFAPLTAPWSSRGPDSPAESPLAWAVLAYARRQIGQLDAGENAAPEPGDVTKTNPGFFTGSISGRVSATDPDGDRLTYSGSTTTDKGRVTVLSSGRFVYTPTSAARHAAATDDTHAKTDTFTVTITDSAGNAATEQVVLDISPTNSAPFGARARAGSGDLRTGAVVITVSANDLDRDTLTFSGPMSTDKGTLVHAGGGTFVYTPTVAARQAAAQPGAPADARTDTLTFSVDDGHGGIRTVSIDVDVTPAIEVGASTPGRAAGPVVVGADGTVYQVTYDVDPDTNLPTRTRVSILDEDGQVLQTTADITGAPVEQTLPVVRPDGSLVLATYRTSSNRTTISIVDGSGTVKTVGTVIGQPSVALDVAEDGTVYLQTSQFPSGSGLASDRLVRISVTDGMRIYQLGRSGGPLTLAPDGSAYLMRAGSLFRAPSLLAIGPQGNWRTVSLPSRTLPPQEVVIGADGRGYLVSARTTFGNTVTRVYTLSGTSSTVRDIAGAPAGSLVAAPDGVYQATFDASTGQSYVSKITAGGIDTSDPLDGSVVNTLTVSPGGTVYVSLRNSAAGRDSVAVIRPSGLVATVDIPGTIVPVGRATADRGLNENIGENGYVAYTADGTTYLAVIDPDGAIDRTVELPEGAVISRAVSYGPDGSAYQLIEYRDSEGRVAGQAVLALATDTVTPALTGSPLRPNYDALQFGPDGTGYLVTVEAATFTHHFLAFDANGATVASLDVTGPLVPQQVDGHTYLAPLAFGPDGTAYATLSGADAGVWALGPGGATQVVDVDLAPGETISPVAFGPDGTPYVTLTQRDGDEYVTTVQTFTSPVLL